MSLFVWTVFVFFTLLGLSESSEIRKRVVNGQNAPTGKRQFYVQVLAEEKDGTTAKRCGGSIVHENWVVTAASCVKGLKETTVFVKDFTKSTETERKIKATVDICPDYNSVTGEEDIALLKLEKAVPKPAKPIELCKSSQGRMDPVFVCGMGLDRLVQPGMKKEYPEKLQEAKLHEEKCSLAVPIKEDCNVVLLKGQSHECINQGDDGGPAYIVNAKDQEALCLYGVAGPVERSDKCPSKMQFTRVSVHKKWIKEKIPSLN